ncbi:hypothetical protein BC940DRAFT_68496 [Gongronella butleri]|nr:hypothetical protein BC940DRAFT_68496 [Gongronella butleri]
MVQASKMCDVGEFLTACDKEHVFDMSIVLFYELRSAALVEGEVCYRDQATAMNAFFFFNLNLFFFSPCFFFPFSLDMAYLIKSGSQGGGVRCSFGNSIDTHLIMPICPFLTISMVLNTHMDFFTNTHTP